MNKTSRKKTQPEWEQEINELKDALHDYPNDKTLKTSMKTQIEGWYKTLTIFAQVPGNERKPWSVSEIGMPIESMPLKQQSGFNQVGDYNIRIRGNEIDLVGGLVVERKSMEDMYGTVMHSDQSERLHREIDRFNADPRFDTFIIFAECTNAEFIEHRNVGNHGTDLTNAKNGKCASLYLDHAPIWWCDSRQNAALLFKFATKQWVIKNWEKVMSND